MLGGAARVDLLGQRIAPFLARWLHSTIHSKLLKLPDDVRVYPTHGGGSFCSAVPPPGDKIFSTIGEERENNPFAAHEQEEDFVQFALTGLGSYPAYYKYMADINRRGPDVLGEIPRLASLTPLSLRNQLEEGSLLVDARSQLPFNERHIAGSFSVPLGDNFSTWVGWVVPWQKPLVFLAPDPASNDFQASQDSPASRESIVRQLIRIGYDRFNGYLAGGLEAWRQAGLPLESINRLDLETLHELSGQSQESLISDVRQSNEFQAGHISGSLNIELGELSGHLDGLPRELPIVALCASGMRATIAGSILRRDGRSDVRVVDQAGAPEWISRGYPSQTGSE